MVVWGEMGIWEGGAPDFLNRFKGGRDQKSLRTTVLEEDSWERRQLTHEWVWFQRRQWTHPKHLRAENTAF